MLGQVRRSPVTGTGAGPGAKRSALSARPHGMACIGSDGRARSIVVAGDGTAARRVAQTCARNCFPARFGIRYAKRNRRCSADLRAVRTGKPGDRFGEIAMTIFNEGRHAIRALGAALASIAGRTKKCFAQGLTRAEGAPLGIMPGRRVAGSPGRRVAGSPGRRVAGSPGRRVAGSPGRRVAGSPGRRVAGSPGRRVAGSPGRRVAGSPGRRVAGSPNLRSRDGHERVRMAAPPKTLRLPA